MLQQRRFVSLDTGCNGLVFVQMRKHGGEPGPREIVQHMMTTAASTRKHMSRSVNTGYPFGCKAANTKLTALVDIRFRFILRVLPIEVSCYSSEEEISRAIKPLVEQYFPIETDNPQKVLRVAFLLFG